MFNLKNKFLIIDFDSTFIEVESLDELARIALENDPDKDSKLNKIEEITNLGMEGKINFPTSLKSRLELFNITKEDIKELTHFLKQTITPSFIRNKEFLEEFSDNIYIISGGFKDYIDPIVTEFGIKSENILANTFVYDKKGKVNGVDEDNLLFKVKGKVKVLEKLNLDGDVYVIGDGYTDYEIKKEGLASAFFAFNENITRTTVNSLADYCVNNLSEVLFQLNLFQNYDRSEDEKRVSQTLNKYNLNLLTIDNRVNTTEN